MKTPANSDVNGSFFNEGIQNLLMHYGNSVIFDFEFRAFEVNSVSEENEESFPCWYCYFPFSRKITICFFSLDPDSIDLNPAVINNKEENCLGDQLIVYMSIKTTPLIWIMLENEVFFDAQYPHVINIYEAIHIFVR